MRTYDDVISTYKAIFSSLGVPCVMAAADSGAMGGSHSHEFQVLSEMGDDAVLICPRCSECYNLERYAQLASVAPDAGRAESQHLPCLKCAAGSTARTSPPSTITATISSSSSSSSRSSGSSSSSGSAGSTIPLLERKTGIEVGHTFLLGSRYSAVFGPKSLDGRSPVEMGCYGLGVSRIMAAVAESSSDDSGIIWPKPIAPYSVVVVPGSRPNKEPEIWETARRLCERLVQSNPALSGDVLLDDREDEFIGFKMREADFLGCPNMVVVGSRFKSDGKVELQYRHSKNKVRMSLDEVVAALSL
eukprot:gnl/Spiro4/18019_TR9620_c1_g1_i1.p1 gnl/Spiro4/18019_TR9620_c1_g1~~gnl/Spiro4/18019_TR9620_c1_g1_i1.p1  ORF type:complete len:303 (+),score=58.42 gnl/Spiro4/18019_TR9620_c1_g1_i1:786-1694(+)